MKDSSRSELALGDERRTTKDGWRMTNDKLKGGIKMSHLFSRANGLMTRPALPVLISLAVLALAALTLTTASAAPRGLTFTVDSTGDAADTNPGDGICHTAK